MANLSLTTVELEKVLKVVSGTTILMGLAVAGVRHFMFGADVTQALLVGLTSAIGYAVTAGMFLLKRPWTSERLARWAGRPLIHGLWFGQLTSDFVDSTGAPRKDIPIAFVIKQTYLGYSMISYTRQQDSETLVESLEVDAKTDIVRLRYIYEFLVMENNERKLTMGAAELKLLDRGTRLRGHYLTNSPTHGAADLQFIQREICGIDTFEAAKKAYQIWLARPIPHPAATNQR